MLGKVSKFDIVYDRPRGVYFAGETVTGKVVLVLTGPKSVRQVSFKAEGEAKTYWVTYEDVEKRDGTSTIFSESHTSSEHYLHHIAVLAAPPRGETSMTIEAGTYEYPFSFDIPNRVPCSFEHKFGQVRYTTKAVLDRPWRFDHKAVSAFTVITHHDLNLYPRLLVGIDDELIKSFHSFFCFGESGSMSINVKTRVSGFVPGETIELSLNCVNTTPSIEIEYASLSLKKNIAFLADERKYVSETVKKQRYDGFPSEGEKILNFKVPPVPPSNWKYCVIINVNYELKLTIGTSGIHHKIKKKYPITIGTIPFRYQTSAGAVPSAPEIDPEETDSEESDSEEVDPEETNPAADPLPSYVQVAGDQPIGFKNPNGKSPEIPPPSYEECLSGGKLIGDPNEQGLATTNLHFTPRYPVYNMPMPMPTAPNGTNGPN